MIYYLRQSLLKLKTLILKIYRKISETNESKLFIYRISIVLNELKLNFIGC